VIVDIDGADGVAAPAAIGQRSSVMRRAIGRSSVLATKRLESAWGLWITPGRRWRRAGGHAVDGLAGDVLGVEDEEAGHLGLEAAGARHLGELGLREARAEDGDDTPVPEKLAWMPRRRRTNCLRPAA